MKNFTKKVILVFALLKLVKLPYIAFFSGFLPMHAAAKFFQFFNHYLHTYLHTIILTQNSMSREHLYLLNKYVSRYYSIPFTIPLQPFSPRHFPPAIFPLNLVEISPPFSPQVSKFGINT